MKIVKKGKDIGGFIATKEEYEKFVDSIIKQIMSKEDFKRYLKITRKW